ncbi:AAA-ATPase vps4-associated protein 1 domain-containing protein [Sarocladium implicatum]|nr:AAA-ATPase vps4-associated protein 1 domain-containing protein [Sarocladium implicatum]
MSVPFPNLYTHRKVAEASSKSCDICYKQTTSVLITSDKKDFFYVCPIHLKDRNFCLPKIDEAAVAAKKREKELKEETEKLKKEYEEKQRKKKEKEAEKDEKDKDKDKDKDGKSDSKSKDDDKTKKEDDDKKEEEPEEEPRVFELKKQVLPDYPATRLSRSWTNTECSTFYNARLQKRRQLEAAKRDRERVKQPGYFPSVPTEPPAK